MYLFHDGGSKKYWKSHDFQYKNSNKEANKKAKAEKFAAKRAKEARTVAFMGEQITKFHHEPGFVQIDLWMKE